MSFLNKNEKNTIDLTENTVKQVAHATAGGIREIAEATQGKGEAVNLRVTKNWQNNLVTQQKKQAHLFCLLILATWPPRLHELRTWLKLLAKSKYLKGP